MPDGEEKELERSVEESGESRESEPPVVKRTVKRTVRDPTGQEKIVEEPEYVSPLEVSTTEESEPVVQEKRVRGTVIRTVRRRSVVTTQRKVVRRIVERPDGRKDGPIEDEIEEPIEEPEAVVPDEITPEVQEVKDRKGVVIRRVVRRPVPVRTARKVYRTITYAPDGKEESVEEKVEEPGQPEEVIVPMEYSEAEAVPEEPTRRQIFRTPVPKEEIPSEAMPEETVTRQDGRVIRRAVTVRKRTIRKVIILPDGTRKEVEEEVPEDVPVEPTPEETATQEDGVVKKTVTLRKRTIRKIIIMPDGTRKEVEEEVPEVPDTPEDVKEVIRTVQRHEPEKVTRRQVYRRVTSKEESVESEKKEPRKVERMYVRRLIKKPDGTQSLIDESETITPVEVLPTEQEPEQVRFASDCCKWSYGRLCIECHLVPL